jgi:(1->4)-alpha-D-glucan 1-alpha-D-glucosylmutase
MLTLRREHPEWFGADAAYCPIIAEGAKNDHVVAYLRGDYVAVIVPRWSLKLGGNWSSTALELPQGKWRNRLTGESVTAGRVRVQTLLQRFPVALLTREAE